MRYKDKITAEELSETLLEMRDEAQAKQLMRFFKTGTGQYGEGDRFLGIKNPQVRAVVREARLRVPLDEIHRLIESEWHEVRLTGFLLLVEEMHASIPKSRDSLAETRRKAERRSEIAGFYLRHARRANNWDLVDLSCPKILGEWLLHPDPAGNYPDRSLLDRLAKSENLWEQRIAIVTTWRLIHDGQCDEALRLSESLLPHPHDLIHKAIGWMLREVGKQDLPLLLSFLEDHYGSMPRTSLRYAIEKFPEPLRLAWLRR